MIGLTVSGFVKVWILTGNESSSSEPIYEQEFKQIKTLNALTLTCNTYNQSTVLIVCTKYWQVWNRAIITSEMHTNDYLFLRYMTLMISHYFFRSTINEMNDGLEVNFSPVRKFWFGQMLEKVTSIIFLASKLERIIFQLLMS